MKRSFPAFLALSTFGLLVVAACSRPGAAVPPSNPVGAAAPEQGKPAASEMAPTPYTLEQVRASNQAGTLYRYKVEKSGEPTRIKILQFKTALADTAEVQSQETDEAGKETKPASIDKATWEELRRHAEFPRAALTVEAGSIEVPAGKFDTMIYIVRTPKGDTMRFHFAKSYAGPPVLFSTEHEGVRVMTQTLLERKAGGS